MPQNKQPPKNSRDEDDRPRPLPAEGSVVSDYEQADFEQLDNEDVDSGQSKPAAPAPNHKRGGETGQETRQSKSARYK